MNCCKNLTRGGLAGRCFNPLIEICDSTTQIKLDLSSCEPCSQLPVLLEIEKAGCIEYEVICEPRPQPCCGVIDNRPEQMVFRKTLKEKPKPKVVYPLHEIDTEGYSVFYLDENLKELGYGRLKGRLFAGDEEPYHFTGIEIDINYFAYTMGLRDLRFSSYLPNNGDC